MNPKQKIQKYFKLQRKIKELELKISELRNIQDIIFMSRFKTNDIASDAQGIFDVFLNNPENNYDRYNAIRSSQWRWSKESQKHHVNKIFKILFEEKFIIRTGNGFYKLNPVFTSTIKRNFKKE